MRSLVIGSLLGALVVGLAEFLVDSSQNGLHWLEPAPRRGLKNSPLEEVMKKIQPSLLAVPAAPDKIGTTAQSPANGAAELVEVNKKKPRLVIMAGPPKTGSTTLQMQLTMLKDKLMEDGFLPEGAFFVEGHEMHPPILASLRDRELTCRKETAKARMDSKPMPPCWTAVTDELERAYEKGLSMVMVSETLHGDTFDMQSFLAATENWQVEIVLHYRPFFSWLASLKNQHEKQIKWSKSFPTESFNSSVEFFTHDRHRPLRAPPLYEAVAQQREENTDCVFGCCYLDMPVGFYGQAAPHIKLQIIDMREGISDKFFCDILNATNACEALKELQVPPSNPSVDTSYDLLATTALELGMLKIENPHVRPTVVKSLKQFHEEELKSEPLPLECTNQKGLDRLLKASLRLEREFAPQFHNESRLRAEFATSVNNKKFCSADVFAMLKDQRWQQFFADNKF